MRAREKRKVGRDGCCASMKAMHEWRKTQFSFWKKDFSYRNGCGPEKDKVAGGKKQFVVLLYDIQYVTFMRYRDIGGRKFNVRMERNQKKMAFGRFPTYFLDVADSMKYMKRRRFKMKKTFSLGKFRQIQRNLESLSVRWDKERRENVNVW